MNRTQLVRKHLPLITLTAALVACGGTDNTATTSSSGAAGSGGSIGEGGAGATGGAGGAGAAGGAGGMAGGGGMAPNLCETPPPAEAVPADANCQFTAPPGALNPVVKWQKNTFTVAPEYNQVIVTPVVGNLTDDNGDGKIDANDTPDIVFTTYFGATGWFGDGFLRVISGKDGTELWSAPGVRGGAGVAIGDVNNDGKPEVYSVNNAGSLVAFSETGAPLWSCPAQAGVYGYPSIANADSAGNAEILLGSAVCSSDGTLLVKTKLDHNWYFGQADFYSPTSFFADIDQDGTMEIVSGAGVSRLDGSTLWSGPGGHAAVANFDVANADPVLPEVVIVHAGLVSILRGIDGAELWSRSGILDAYGGPPTVADFDGDGKAEIGVAASSVYAVFDPDSISGVLWKAPIQDNTSYVTGSSVFDFNGDGKAEVVYADEQTLWAFDGETGNVVAQMADHASATYHEYPVMADVDKDGHADIILASNNTYISGPWNGITVLSGANNDWATGRPVWNEHAYHITNVSDDLSIPTKEPAHWLSRNSFREGGFGQLGALAATDLKPVLLATCNESCPAKGRFVYRFENVGAVVAPLDTPYAIVGIDQNGNRTPLTTGTLKTPLNPGWSTDTMEYAIDPATAAQYTKIVLVIDNDGNNNSLNNECNENNNEITLPAVCP